MWDRVRPTTLPRRGSDRAPARLMLAIGYACLLACASAQSGAGSWDFRGAADVQAARQQASGDSNFRVFSNKVGATTMGGTGSTVSTSLQEQFDDWCHAMGYTFTADKYQQAMLNFRDNMARVYQINTDPSKPFWASGNKFSHLTFEQFSQTYLMSATTAQQGLQGVGTAAGSSVNNSLQVGVGAVGAAAEVNWVTAGKVTPVKDQSSCGSCWAFAATAVIESAYLFRYGGASNSIDLSEQQLVSCCNAANGCRVSSGCDGGLSDEAINYVSTYSQTTESRYPYTSSTGACNGGIVSSNANGISVRLNGRATLVTPSSDENALKQAVSNAPAVIYFDVEDSFQHYAGGVYQPTDCGTSTNHAMVLVGYSTSGGYWLVRNSWSARWGESGYARVAMTGNGAGPCGMYQYAYQSPTDFSWTLGAPGPTPSPTPSPPPGDCVFYDSDHTTRSVMTQTYSACESCRAACEVHPTCYYYTWRGSPQTSYSSNSVCGTPSPSPTPRPTPGPSSGCGWYASDNATSLTPTGDTSTCSSCQQACAPDPQCYFFTWNGAHRAAFNDGSFCGSQPAPTPTPIPKPAPSPTPTPTPRPNGACRWFLGDQTTPDTPTGNTSTCEGCRSGCQAAPNCYYLSWNNGPVTSYTATTVCGGTPTPSPRPTPAPTPMPPAICEWYNSDRVTRLALNGNTSTCEACRQGCQVHPTCIYLRWNGGSFVQYTSTAACGNGCSWWRIDQQTSVQLSGDTSSCEACRQGCEVSSTCYYYTFGASSTLNYFSSTAPCGSPTPSPAPTPSPRTNTACAWWNSDRSATIQPYANATTCEACRQGCQIHPTCYFLAWNGGAVRSYGETTQCSPPFPPNPSPSCVWYRADRATTLVVTGSPTNCTACRDGCQGDSYCMYIRWANGPVASYDAANVCGGQPTPAPSPRPNPGPPLNPLCRWYRNDASTPDTDSVPAGDTSTCEGCRSQCQAAQYCYYLSWSGGPVTPYDQTNMCGNGPLPTPSPTPAPTPRPGPPLSPSCRWFQSDGTTPDTNSVPTGDTSTCEGCRSQCQAAQYCFYLSWSGGPITSYGQANVCGNGPQPTPSPTPSPRPSPTPSPNHGLSPSCRWFESDGATPDTDSVPTGDTSTCEGCRSQCQAAQYCFYLSWRNGPVTSYGQVNMCGNGPQPTPSPTPSPRPSPTPSPGPSLSPSCRWFQSDGTTPDTQSPVTGDTSTCEGCRNQCQAAPYCYYISWNSGAATSYGSLNACSQSCLWFRTSDTSTSLSTAGYDTTTCQTCQSSCAQAPDCLYYSWGGGSAVRYSQSCSGRK